MEKIMFKRKVKNFAVISMIAISLGASPANAEDELAAPFSIISGEELVSLLKKMDSSAVSSHSQKRIKFSKEWLCGMTAEGLRNLDLNIIDFTAIEEEKAPTRKAVLADDNNPYFRLINQSDVEAIKEEKASYNWEVVIKSRIMLIKAAQEDLREVLIKHAELVSNYQDACKPKFQAPKVSWSDLKPINTATTLINMKSAPARKGYKSQTGLKDFRKPYMQALKPIKPIAPRDRAMQVAFGALNTEVDGKEMAYPTQELLKNFSSSMNWLAGLTEAEVDALKLSIKTHELLRWLRNKADQINQFSI
jgi:hypothetical protein